MNTNEKIEAVLAELVAMESAWFASHTYRDVDVYASLLEELMPADEYQRWQAAQQDGN